MRRGDEAAVWLSAGLDSIPATLRLADGRVVLSQTDAGTPVLDAEVEMVQARRLRSGVIELSQDGIPTSSCSLRPYPMRTFGEPTLVHGGGSSGSASAPMRELRRRMRPRAARSAGP
jgi:hypothetical protein